MKLVKTIKIQSDWELHVAGLKHAAEISRIINNHRSHFTPWFPWAENSNLFANQAFLKTAEKDYKNGKALHMVILVHKLVVGLAAFTKIDQGNKKAVLGYWLSPEAVGKGIMKGSLSAMIDCAFGALEMETIQLHCAINNERSVKLAERLGFQLDGIVRSDLLVNDQHIDRKYYSLLRNEWNKNAPALLKQEQI